MDNHLNDSQIEELLRTNESYLDAGSEQDEHGATAAATPVRHPLGLHLDSCEPCRLRVQALRDAGQRLTLLKAPATAGASAQCPPHEVWFRIAAGLENPGFDNDGLESLNAESCLNHAIHCEHCGQLLAQAAAELSEELTPHEESQIAALSSSSPDWQIRLAAKLQTGEADKQAERAKQSGHLAPAIAFFAPSRMALAAAFIAAVVLGIQDYRLQERLFDQTSQTSAEMHRLQSDTEQQKTQIAELGAQQQTQQTSLTSAPSIAQGVTPALIASLTLDTGLTRGSGETKRLTIPPSAEIVKITLHTPKNSQDAATGGVMHEELLTADRRKIWSQEFQPSAAETSASSLSLLIPAYLLTPDDYIVVLSRQAPNGPEELASYNFRVPR